MTITVRATYENGILKPVQPLPLDEHEQVELTITRPVSRARLSSGMLGWTGDAETLDRLLAEENRRDREIS